MRQTATDVVQVRVLTQQTADGVAEIMRSIDHLQNNSQSRTQTLKHLDEKEEKRLSFSLSFLTTESHPLAGTQLRESIREWLSPPDPSKNHDVACDTHHKTTASWFFQGGIFQEWKSTGSLLWIHGKRLPRPLSYLTPLMRFCVIAGSGKSVLWFVDSQLFMSEMTDVSSQFHVDSRHRSHVQGRKRGHGVLLF